VSEMTILEAFFAAARGAGLALALPAGCAVTSSWPMRPAYAAASTAASEGHVCVPGAWLRFARVKSNRGQAARTRQAPGIMICQVRAKRSTVSQVRRGDQEQLAAGAEVLGSVCPPSA
jgi:hypothetical protein